MIPLIIYIFSQWIFLTPVFCGIGLLFFRTIGIKKFSIEEYFLSFWIGCCFILFFLQIWHLFAPINSIAFYTIFFLGLFGIITNSQQLKSTLTFKKLKEFFFPVVFTFPIAIWIAYRSQLPFLIYDSGLYHLQNIRWATTYSIIPGIANLHSQEAFHSTYFLLCAMLDKTPIPLLRSYNYFNGLLATFLIFQIILQSIKLLRQQRPPALNDLFLLGLFIPILHQGLTVFISSPSPDFPIFILGLVLAHQLFLFIEKNLEFHQTKLNFLAITCLCAAGTTIKLSFVVFGVASFLLATIKTIAIQPRRFNTQDFFLLINIILIVLIPWGISNLLLSGYLFFPSTLGAIPVEWKVPQASVINIINTIYSWPRTPWVHWTKVLGNSNWFIPWLQSMKQNIFEFVMPSLIFTGGLLIFIWGIFRRKYCWCSNNIVWLFPFAPLIAIICWFMTAPDIRFAGSTFWTLSISSFLLATSFLQAKRIAIFLITLNIFIISIFTPALWCDFTHSYQEYPKKFIRQNSLPTPNLKFFTTTHGLKLYIPAKGDQCWDAPLPCTPYPHKNLKLRKEGVLQSGFIISPKNKDDEKVGFFYDF